MKKYYVGLMANEWEHHLIINTTLSEADLTAWLRFTLSVIYSNIQPYDEKEEHNVDADGEITIIL